jgi:hypothetical protein
MSKAEETGVAQGWTILGWVAGRLGATAGRDRVGCREPSANSTSAAGTASTASFPRLFSWFSSPPL